MARRIVVGVGLAGALLCTFLGQRSFLGALAFTWFGLQYAVLGIVCFAATVFLSQGKIELFYLPKQAPCRHQQPPVFRPVALGLSAVIMVALLAILAGATATGNYTATLLLWFAAIGCFLVGVAPGQDTKLLNWDLKKRVLDPQLWLVLLIVAAAFSLRIYNLETIPTMLGGDEASQGLEAIAVLEGRISNPFSTGWLGVPTMSFYFNAPGIALFGKTIFGLRFPWVLVGTATVLTTFLFVRRLQGTTLGLLTAGLLAAYHYHIHFSRLGSNQIADPLFITLALLFFYRGYDEDSLRDWALAGVVIGVSQYSYAGARFTGILVCALLLLLTLREGRAFWHHHGMGIAIMAGAALIASAPMLQYSILYPEAYNIRLNTVGIFQTSWLEDARRSTGDPDWKIFLNHFTQAALVFTAYPDKSSWYGSPKPLFDLIDGILFLLGLGIITLRVWDRRLASMALWWWGTIIAGGFLTTGVPSVQRLVGMSVPSIFCVALALVMIARLAGYVWLEQPIRFERLLTGGVGLVIGIGSVAWYFFTFTPRDYYAGINTVTTTAMGNYARDKLGPDWRIYFLGPPFIYANEATIRYLAPDVESQDVIDTLVKPPDPASIAADKQAAFIALPARHDELLLIQQTFPGGSLEEIYWPISGQVLCEIYRVPRDQIRAAQAK
jgi:hypothetical protein